MEMDYDSSDTDSDDVFMGPITKREIVTRLKYYKILSEEYLEPLSDLKKTDVVDEDLVAFYWNIFTSRESMACADNPERKKSIYQDLEQRKSLYTAEISERCNTPANSSQTEKSDGQSESFNDSLNRSRDSLQELKQQLNESVNNSHKDFNCSIDEQNNEASIITISDDSYTFNEIKNETLEEIQIKLEDITNDDINIDNIEKQVTNSLQLDEITNEKKSNCLKNDEISNEEEPNNEIEINDSENQLLNSLKIDEIPIVPIVNVPNILRNAEPIDEMSILSDTFITKNSDLENYCPSPSFHEQDDSFNDTLEEMEMLMKFGENYMKQKQDTSVHSDISVRNSIRSNISEGFDDSNGIYEKISKQQNKFEMNSPSSSKHYIKNESRAPLRKETNTNTPLPKTPSVLKPDNCIETHFKVPIKAAPPSARKSPNYKSIVSPISLYIKNSPKVPLIKKVNTPTVHSATYREIENKDSSEKSHEKAIPTHSALPIRTYKLAAKNIFLSKENEPHIPNNIRKLIKGPLNPEIIKHVGRVKATPNLPASPSTNFSNNADLTILSSTSASEGIFNISTTSEGDVSLYVSKNAARTNFSTKK